MDMISIIMPAHNAEVYIAESIECVLKQTYSEWELIVINDGSTDLTPEIVESYKQKENRITLINQTNKQLGAARNTGIKAARGNWIAFLDSDDIWIPNKLEKQIAASIKHPEADLIYTDGYIFFEDDFNNFVPYPTQTGIFTGAEMYKMEYIANYIPVLSVLVKHDLVKRIGFQEERPYFHGSEDWDYWLRMAYTGASFLGLNEKLFYYRRHTNNMSNNNINMRLSQAAVFIKNYDASFFTIKETESIFKPLVYPLILQLVKLNRLKDARYLLNGMTQIFNRLSIKLKLLQFSIRVFGENTSVFIKSLQKLGLLNRFANV
jgi:glycosyltransferase involved in cell wall biosynthesis